MYAFCINKRFGLTFSVILAFMYSTESSPFISFRSPNRYQRLISRGNFEGDIIMDPSYLSSDTKTCKSCIDLDKCAYVKSAIRRQPSLADLHRYLVNVTCAFEGKRPKICCDHDHDSTSEDNISSGMIVFEEMNSIDHTTTISPRRLNEVTPIEPDTHPKHPSCGMSFTNKIIGGESASYLQFPWTARLALEGLSRGTKRKTVDFACGGALISAKHVLTAAHCVLTSQKLLFVRLGQTTQRTRNTQDLKPLKIKVHEHYGLNQYRHDIAVITLKEEAKINVYVIPICLPSGPDFLDGTISTGQAAVLAGWGAMKPTGSASSSILQWINQHIMDPAACSKLYKEKKKIEIGREQLCTKTGENATACRGDSGGPLFVDKDGTIPATIIGIVSFGPKQCNPSLELPTVYTSVAYYVDWIRRSIA